MKTLGRRTSNRQYKSILNIIKIIFFTYLLTAILLFLLAFLMYKLDLGDREINFSITIIVIITTFLGGLMAGKTMKEKRWLYGAIVGVSYFVILVITSLIINKDGQITQDALTLFLMCTGGGIIGGMLG